jgi:hypothetical protein
MFKLKIMDEEDDNLHGDSHEDNDYRRVKRIKITEPEEIDIVYEN